MAIDPFAPLAEAQQGAGARGAAAPPEWRTLMPVPADACARPSQHPKLGKPSRLWEYRAAGGALLGGVARFDPPGGKTILPISFCEGPRGARAWRWQSWLPPRPLYGLDELARRPDARVIVTEGEKAADAARRLLPEYAFCRNTLSLRRRAGRSLLARLTGRL